jgi:hypothetical protein
MPSFCRVDDSLPSRALGFAFLRLLCVRVATRRQSIWDFFR